MKSYQREKLNWMDLLWLLFLGGLAVLPPIAEVHKQLILLAIGVLQLFEAASSVTRRSAAVITW